MVIKIQAIVRGYIARKLFKLKVEKSIAIQTIQYNARIFIGLQNSPWWKLYSSVKPLINVSKTDESIKKLQEQLSEEKQKYELHLTDNVKLKESSKTLQQKIDKLKKELEETKERNLYLESLNQEMEGILKERDGDIVRLTGYLDRFCSLFKSLTPVNPAPNESETKEESG